MARDLSDTNGIMQQRFVTIQDRRRRLARQLRRGRWVGAASFVHNHSNPSTHGVIPEFTDSRGRRFSFVDHGDRCWAYVFRKDRPPGEEWDAIATSTTIERVCPARREPPRDEDRVSKRQFSIRLESDVYDALKRAADARQLSMASMAHIIFESWFAAMQGGER